MKKIKTTKIPNQLMGLNKVLHTTRWINISLCTLFGILLVTHIYILNRPPIVVIDKGEKKAFFQGKHLKAAIGKEEVEEFIKKFVVAYYSFDSFEDSHSLSLIKRIAPLSTRGLRHAIRNRPLKTKDLKEKKVSQRVLDVRVYFEKNGVMASFEKLLRIEGVPFIIATQVAFKLRHEKGTHWNPMGIYVDGVIEHEKIP